jgi:hypothetical protein
MLTVTIGEVVGMSHYRRGRRARGVPPAYGHFPHRAITSPVEGFHFGQAGTFHRMRPYVVEYPDHDAFCRFEWRSRCGIVRLFVDTDGRCELGREARPSLALSPFCPRCTICQRLADDEAVGLEVRRRLAPHPDLRLTTVWSRGRRGRGA